MRTKILLMLFLLAFSFTSTEASMKKDKPKSVMEIDAGDPPVEPEPISIEDEDVPL